jgi:membrane-associated phospholipid phosphatase
LVSSSLVLAALIASRLASGFIAVRFPGRPMPPDLLFDTLPYVSWMQYVTDLALLTEVALLFAYVFRGHLRRLPEMLAMFGIMELLRAFIITLTPLAGPLGNGAFHGIVRATQNGEFPSGHAASALLFFLFVDPDEAPGLRRVMGVLATVVCLAMLLSHGHYSMDIVGGLLLSYFVYHEYCEGRLFDWLKPYVTP